MTARARLATAALLGLLGTSVLTSSPAGAARAARPSTDLAVELTNKADAKPGKKMTYTIVVRNNGKAAARRVRIDFKTSAGLKRIAYKISSGYCYHRPKETTCTFGTVKPGKTATVAITGVMSKKLKKGTAVTNKVTLASSTKLTNPADDVATDNFQIGVPRVAPAVPAPSPSTVNKITKFTNAAGKVFDLSKSVVNVTLIVLAAAILWFIVGLTLRHRSRLKRGITDDY